MLQLRGVYYSRIRPRARCGGCDVPKVYIAKMQFDRMKDWTKGCSPSNHSLFYNAIHGNSWTPFWGLQKLEKQEHDLTDLTQKNYKDVIFGTIEKMAK